MTMEQYGNMQSEVLHSLISLQTTTKQQQQQHV